MRTTMRKNKNPETNRKPTSHRMGSGRELERDFDTDADLYRNNEDYYRNEGRHNQSPRSDYDFEQDDQFGMSQGQRFSSPMDTTGRYNPSSEIGNSRDYTGNFPSAELSGLHSGKGPKGYQRSEDRIREDVCDALEAHGHIDASEIEVEVSDGVVTLTGSVESRQSKRLAEQAVERVRGIKDIHNHLTISSSREIERQSSGFQVSSKNKKNKKPSANYKQ